MVCSGQDRRYQPRACSARIESGGFINGLPHRLVDEGLLFLGSSCIHPKLAPQPMDDELRRGAKQRPLYAVLVESLNSSRALLSRLELGVSAPPGEAREAVREAYVACRRLAHALAVCLELPLE
jgi:hypothetical protein